jgi:hypothetical protein
MQMDSHPDPQQNLESPPLAADSNEWLPTRKDAYTALVAIVQHAEATSWNRFYNFLMFSTILVLAWSTIYSQSSRPKSASLVMALIAVVGILSGLAWSVLGYRGRKFVKHYLEEGEKIDKTAAEGCRLFHRTITFGNEYDLRFLNSTSILIGTPLVFSALYLVLFIVSLAP